jgi:hypothetical protein
MSFKKGNKYMLSQIIKKSLFPIKTISFTFLSMVFINSYANDNRPLLKYLPLKTAQILERHHITTIQKLLDLKSLNEISYLKDIGATHLEYIETMMTELGLSFFNAEIYEESIKNRFSIVAGAEESGEIDED